MKHKPDESPDQWVRQTLSQLPDTPPPGSSFDTERVWAQLLPELQAAPRRRTGLAWWVAAACMAGLMVGWLVLHSSSDDRTKLVAHKSNPKADELVIAHSKPTAVEAAAALKPVLSTERKPVLALRTRSHFENIPQPNSISRMTEKGELRVVQSPELLTDAEVLPMVEKLPELPKLNVAITTPKRRFKVVHENELRTQDEAQPKLYRTEHFVRLGAGRSEEPAPEERHPTLVMPLITKPNH